MGACTSKGRRPHNRHKRANSSEIQCHGVYFIPQKIRKSRSGQLKDNLGRITSFSSDGLGKMAQNGVAGRSEPHWRSVTDYPFENIVFSGGGSKGYAYIGALKALADCGVLPKITRTAGSSVGAICSALVAVGCSPQEIADLFAGDEFYIKWLFHDQKCTCFCCVPKIWKRYGLNAATRFYRIFGEYVTRKVDNADITFAELYREFGRELCIVVTNLSKMRCEYCHWKTTPDLPIRDAVRMSMSFPLLYEPVKCTVNGETCLYIDGGTLDQFPIHCFDGPDLEMNHNVEDKNARPNEKSIGLYVVSETTIDYKIWNVLFNRDIPTRPTYLPETKLAKQRMEQEYTRRKRKDKSYTKEKMKEEMKNPHSQGWIHYDTVNKEHVQIKSIGEFFLTTIETLLVSQRQLHIKPPDIQRTVSINCGYVGTNDYILEPQDKSFLIEQGYAHTKQFLEEYLHRRREWREAGNRRISRGSSSDGTHPSANEDATSSDVTHCDITPFRIYLHDESLDEEEADDVALVTSEVQVGQIARFGGGSTSEDVELPPVRPVLPTSIPVVVGEVCPPCGGTPVVTSENEGDASVPTIQITPCKEELEPILEEFFDTASKADETPLLSDDNDKCDDVTALSGDDVTPGNDVTDNCGAGILIGEWCKLGQDCNGNPSDQEKSPLLDCEGPSPVVEIGTPTNVLGLGLGISPTKEPSTDEPDNEKHSPEGITDGENNNNNQPVDKNVRPAAETTIIPRIEPRPVIFVPGRDIRPNSSLVNGGPNS